MRIPLERPHRLWSAPLRGRICVHEGLVLEVDQRDVVTRDLKTGEERWSLRLPATAWEVVALDRNLVAVPIAPTDDSHRVFRLRMDGTIAGIDGLDPNEHFLTLHADGRGGYVEHRSNAYGTNKVEHHGRDGAVLWSSRTFRGPDAERLGRWEDVHDGALFFRQEEEIACVRNGGVAWYADVPFLRDVYFLDEAILFEGPDRYADDPAPQLLALDYDGSIRWRRAIPEHSSMALGARVACFYTEAGELMRVSLVDGSAITKPRNAMTLTATDDRTLLYRNPAENVLLCAPLGSPEEIAWSLPLPETEDVEVAAVEDDTLLMASPREIIAFGSRE